MSMARIGLLVSSARNVFKFQNSTINRCFHLSGVAHVRKFVVTIEGDMTIVEAKKIKSPRENNIIEPPEESKSTSACPICRLGMKRILYSDVLILSQFLDTNHRLMAIEDTKLCQKSYAQVKHLVRIAQKCKLLPRPSDYEVYGLWDRLNTYHDRYNRKRDVEMRVVKEKYWD